MPDIDRREKRKGLNEQHEGSRKCTHQREPISRPNHQVNQGERPGEEDEYFEEVGQWTTAQGVAADVEECALESEAEGDRKEIKAARPKISVAYRRQGVSHVDEKTEAGRK